MKTFHIKQKFWSLSGKFLVKDSQDQPCYQVTGSLLRWFKEFTICDMAEQEVAFIKEKFSWFLPRFAISLASGQEFFLQKEFTWFKPRYHIEGLDMVIQGNFWDMDFTLTKNGETIAVINQEWFKLTSTYQVTVHDEAYADLVVALVIAIDYVKEKEAAAASSVAT